MSGSDSDDDFGPMLPPGFEKEAPAPTSRAVIGPTLPPGFATSTSSPTDLIAPLGEDPEEDSSDDDVIGPLLPGQEIDRGYGKITRVRKDDKEKREEWMTVIPDKVEKKLGLKSVTSFCKKGSTTDDLRPKVVSKKDQELTEVLSDYTVSFFCRFFEAHVFHNLVIYRKASALHLYWTCIRINQRRR